jgi:hypothetical protein
MDSIGELCYDVYSNEFRYFGVSLPVPYHLSTKYCLFQIVPPLLYEFICHSLNLCPIMVCGKTKLRSPLEFFVTMYT